MASRIARITDVSGVRAENQLICNSNILVEVIKTIYCNTNATVAVLASLD
jgi:hypothetical protein